MAMTEFFDSSFFSWREALDIAIVTFLFYRGLLLIKGTRALSVMHGFLVILIVYYLSGEFGLVTLHWLLTNFLGSIFLVIIILFQNDIRKALSRVGAGRFLFWPRQQDSLEAVLRETTLAVSKMAAARIGALIVFERNVPLGDVVQRGVTVSAVVSKELLMTIFHPDTPLHDGAVVIRNRSLAAAGCILPLASGVKLDSAYGTRHRAALGVTEESDALAVVASEERGLVSVAEAGELSGPYDEASLLERLREGLCRRS